MIGMETPHREPRLLNAVYFAVNRHGESVVRADGEAELVVTIKDDGDPSQLELRRVHPQRTCTSRARSPQSNRLALQPGSVSRWRRSGRPRLSTAFRET
jgi:hypothetical protein